MTNNTPKNVGYHLTKTPGYAPKTNRPRERRNVLAKKLGGSSRLFRGESLCGWGCCARRCGVLMLGYLCGPTVECSVWLSAGRLGARVCQRLA
nr:MAG TPA: hypothetical protein [Caudoviricetes sp.]